MNLASSKDAFLLLLFLMSAANFIKAQNRTANFSDPSNQSSVPVFADKQVQGGGFLLVASGPGKEVGDDVELVGLGKINLTLTNGELQFEVCPSCVDKYVLPLFFYPHTNDYVFSFVACFSGSGAEDSPAECTPPSSYNCKFEVGSKPKKDGSKQILFNGRPTDVLDTCVQPVLMSPKVDVMLNSYRYWFDSCAPKLDDNVVSLDISKNRDCPIKVVSQFSCCALYTYFF